MTVQLFVVSRECREYCT